MQNALKITCPNCQKEFDAGSAFNSHFEKKKLENEKILKESQIEAKKYKSQLDNNKKEIEKAKIDAAKNAEEEAAKKYAEEEAAKKYKSQLANSQKEIEKAKIDAAKNAEEEAAKKYKTQLANSQKEIEKAKIDAAKNAEEEAAKKYKTQLANSQKEIEKAKIDAAKNEELKAQKLAREVKKKNDAEILKIKRESEITNKRLKDNTDKMNSVMSNQKSELKGEIQEENLQEFLKRKFPDDNVDEIKKGAKGGDCILTINYKGKKNIAKIYFESKDTTSFNEKWCDKLLNDMKDKGIGNGIIVASAACLPTDMDKYTSYVERHGNSITIIPMDEQIIHAIVSKIRSILIFKTRENKDNEIPDVMKKCWANLNSPNFQLPIKSMVNEIKNMEKIFSQERTSFERMSANKAKTINGVKTNLVEIVTSFTRTVGDIFPQDLLEHKDDRLDDE